MRFFREPAPTPAPKRGSMDELFRAPDLSAVDDLNLEIAALQRDYAATADPAQLAAFFAQAQRLQAANPDHAGICLIAANILRKCEGYQAAVAHLLAHARRNPAVDVLYEAALFSIDAGNHADAQAILRRIGRGNLSILTDRQQRGIWRAAPLVGLHNLALKIFEAGAARGNDFSSEPVRQRLHTALANAKHVRKAGVGIVSLGENCAPWHMANRWGFRSEKTLARDESPWSLAQTTVAGVTALLNAPDAALYDPTALRVLTLEDGRMAPYNERFAFTFLHELGADFSSQDFARLRGRYANKAACFERALASPGPCLFLHYSEAEGDLAALVAALRTRLRGPRQAILVIDAWPGSRSPPPGAAYLKAVPPAQKYVWYQPDDYDSPLGVAYERRIAAAIREALPG